MKTILITGGAGYIGCVLCEALLQKEHKVICLDRFYFGQDKVAHLQKYPNFSTIKDDIRLIKKDALKGVNVVMDLSGLSNDPACDLDPTLSEDINVKGAIHSAECAKKAGVERYIISSSCSIYGAGHQQHLSEESPKNPVSLYARSKIESEKAIKPLASDDFCVTFLRNATTYGVSPRMRFDLIVNLMTMYAYTKHKIFVLGGGRQWRPNVHVRDVARAFILTMEAPKDKINGEAFNVGSNEQNYQVLQVANMIREVVPYTEIEIVPDDIDKRSYNVSFDKIHDVLGFRVEHSLHEGAVEVKQALQNGTIDPSDVRTSTINFYKYLIEADRILNEVRLDGRLF